MLATAPAAEALWKESLISCRHAWPLHPFASCPALGAPQLPALGAPQLHGLCVERVEDPLLAVPCGCSPFLGTTLPPLLHGLCVDCC